MNPADIVTTGNKVVDAVLIILGGVGTLATIGATVLPKDWGFTLWLARVASDIRNLRANDASAKKDDVVK